MHKKFWTNHILTEQAGERQIFNSWIVFQEIVLPEESNAMEFDEANVDVDQQVSGIDVVMQPADQVMELHVVPPKQGTKRKSADLQIDEEQPNEEEPPAKQAHLEVTLFLKKS